MEGRLGFPQLMLYVAIRSGLGDDAGLSCLAGSGAGFDSDGCRIRTGSESGRAFVATSGTVAEVGPPDLPHPVMTKAAARIRNREHVPGRSMLKPSVRLPVIYATTSCSLTTRHGFRQSFARSCGQLIGASSGGHVGKTPGDHDGVTPKWSSGYVSQRHAASDASNWANASIAGPARSGDQTCYESRNAISSSLHGNQATGRG